jgi:hypothetical protein
LERLPLFTTANGGFQLRGRRIVPFGIGINGRERSVCKMGEQARCIPFAVFNSCGFEPHAKLTVGHVALLSGFSILYFTMNLIKKKEISKKIKKNFTNLLIFLKNMIYYH